MLELFFKDLNNLQKEKLQELFKDNKDSTVWSCLQGFHGRIFVNEKDNITMSLLLIGDFVFLSNSGDFDINIAESMIIKLIPICNIRCVLMIPHSYMWKEYFKKNSRYQEVKRYAIKKKQRDSFNINYLKELTEQLGKGYRYERMNEEIVHRVLLEEWSSDFCSNFTNPKEFLERGLGVVIFKEDEIVCGASSYTAYDRGIEVGIATKEQYRKLGLATLCSAKLILLCIEREKDVNWDAANMYSVHIAQKLGFEFDTEYNTYIFNNDSTNWPNISSDL